MTIVRLVESPEPDPAQIRQILGMAANNFSVLTIAQSLNIDAEQVRAVLDEEKAI